MTIPRVIFADPEALAKSYLEAQWAPRTEPFKPATITTAYPSSALSTTHIQIDFEDGNIRNYPALERAQIRITCHAPASRRSDVKALASVTQALLYGHPGNDDVACIRLLGGRSGVIADPATKNLMVWFLVQMILRSKPLD